jgi:hypothetical protein
MRQLINYMVVKLSVKVMRDVLLIVQMSCTDKYLKHLQLVTCDSLIRLGEYMSLLRSYIFHSFTILDIRVSILSKFRFKSSFRVLHITLEPRRGSRGNYIFLRDIHVLPMRNT